MQGTSGIFLNPIILLEMHMKMIINLLFCYKKYLKIFPQIYCNEYLFSKQKLTAMDSHMLYFCYPLQLNYENYFPNPTYNLKDAEF